MSKIKELAKELCTCHHKCHDTTDCVVEDEAREYLPFVLTNEDKVSVKVKQIEEMAETILDFVHIKHNQFSMQDLAKALYNAGYRKQSEGEWTYSENKKTMKCTRCRMRMKTYDVRRYCPNCGAKMKGGE